MDAEIKAEFERSGFLFQEEEEQILQKCLSMCIDYSLSPSDLVSNWEIYYLNRQLSGLVLESSHMDGLLLYIQNDMKEKLIKEATKGVLLGELRAGGGSWSENLGARDQNLVATAARGLGGRARRKSWLRIAVSSEATKGALLGELRAGGGSWSENLGARDQNLVAPAARGLGGRARGKGDGRRRLGSSPEEKGGGVLG